MRAAKARQFIRKIVAEKLCLQPVTGIFLGVSCIEDWSVLGSSGTFPIQSFHTDFTDGFINSQFRISKVFLLISARNRYHSGKDISPAGIWANVSDSVAPFSSSNSPLFFGFLPRFAELCVLSRLRCRHDRFSQDSGKRFNMSTAREG